MANLKQLSATNASTADLRKIFDEASSLLKLTGRRTILFIDEIQRFSKSQQDNVCLRSLGPRFENLLLTIFGMVKQFLPVVEAGSISLIASTTENPSFRLNGALLSRCRVFILNKLTPEDIFKVLTRALSLSRPDGVVSSSPLASTSTSTSTSVSSAGRGVIDDDLLKFLASAADGDARVALSSLELAITATTEEGGSNLTTPELKSQLRKAHLQYDRDGGEFPLFRGHLFFKRKEKRLTK